MARMSPDHMNQVCICLGFGLHCLKRKWSMRGNGWKWEEAKSGGEIRPRPLVTFQPITLFDRTYPPFPDSIPSPSPPTTSNTLCLSSTSCPTSLTTFCSTFFRRCWPQSGPVRVAHSVHRAHRSSHRRPLYPYPSCVTSSVLCPLPFHPALRFVDVLSFLHFYPLAAHFCHIPLSAHPGVFDPPSTNLCSPSGRGLHQQVPTRFP